jgi:YbbR domain-containing protein
MNIRRIWPFRHFGLKLLSVALAALLWLVIAGEETVERGLRVPFELQQMPEGLELLGELPATVDVRVRGASGTLGRVTPGDIVTVLDVRGARPGQRLFHLTQDQVRAPAGVEVLQVTPPTVTMVFEVTASKRLPIVPALDGRPAAGYVVGPVGVEPSTVEVVGPKSAVARATAATTEPIAMAGANTTVHEVVTVGTTDPLVRLMAPMSAAVTVQILREP